MARDFDVLPLVTLQRWEIEKYDDGNSGSIIGPHTDAIEVIGPLDEVVEAVAQGLFYSVEKEAALSAGCSPPPWANAIPKTREFWRAKATALLSPQESPSDPGVYHTKPERMEAPRESPERFPGCTCKDPSKHFPGCPQWGTWMVGLMLPELAAERDAERQP